MRAPLFFMNPITILFSFVVLFLMTFSVSADEKWREHRSRHFIIFYQNAPMNFIREVEDAAESEYMTISEEMGVRRMKTWSFDNRAEIYIYDDGDHYVDSGKLASWSHGVASPEDKIIRSYPAAHGFFDSTLPHELAHIMFRELIGYDTRIPLWLEEGVAMYYEKAQRFGAHDDVRQAIEEGTFLSLDELSNMRLSKNEDKEAVNLFYQEAASAVNFMIEELGAHKFKMFCNKLEEDKDFSDAFASIYTRQKDIDGLNKAWIDFLLDE